MIRSPKKILFLVGTEYHMLVTLSAIADLYTDPEKFDVTIYQVDSDHKKRSRSVNLDLSNVQYHSINYSSNNPEVANRLIEQIGEIEKYGYNEFVFFNEHVALCVYLAKSLSSQGARVILAPDGMKAYDNLTQIAPRWSLKFSLRYRKFVRENKGNRKFSFVWPRMRYGFLKETKELWITNPDHFNNWNNKVVTKFDVMQTSKSIALINNFFDFNPVKEMPKRDKVIFLICMPPKYKDIEAFNERLIEYLLGKFPEHALLLKLHPATTKEQIERLEKIERCSLIQSHIPAELFIAQLSDSIVISYWSTSSLINNAKCRFYWLHKALANEIVMPGILRIKNPTNHIIEVQSISEIL